MSDFNTSYNGRMQEDDDEITIDLLALFKELISHWYLILILALLFGGAAFSYCKFLVTPMYESTSELLVLSKSADNTSLSDLQVGSNLTADYMVVVVGRPVIDQVSENLGLNMPYEKLKGKISVKDISDRIIAITVTDADPENAKIITDEIAEVSANYIGEVLNQNKPSIIQKGYTDGRPVSPRTKLLSVLGAAAGFLLACVWITLSYLLNDHIKNVDELETKLGLKILGQLPYEDNRFDRDVNPASKKKK